ncbi:MAG TPA: hypothetical protein VOA41_00915 [Candidatus Dormibacteraeota bacterium]|nr:hypothetical protein [Candidatus Dormibacteraeota bacterium]
MPRFCPVLFAIAMTVLGQPSLWAQRVCPVTESGDLLQDKLPIIKAAIPRRFSQTGRDGFVQPGAGEMSAWGVLTSSMLVGDVSEACRIIDANAFPYTVIQYSDTSDVITVKMYNILQEDIPPLGPIAKGWGTYIFNPASITSLSIEIPHPLFDDLTPEEGIDTFRQLDARTLLMAGTHRYANQASSSCQPDPVGNIADVAHNIDNMFEMTHEAIAIQPPGTLFIQLHGNANSSCSNVAAFVSNGTTTPGSRVNGIVDCVNLGPFIAEAATPESLCILKGTTNVQGRFSNGSPNLCSENAQAASEQFIHIEQNSEIRNPANRQALIDALRCALP